MTSFSFLFLLLVVTTIRAQECPSIWNRISDDLSSSFSTGRGCNNLARGSIRYAFHDAAAFSQSLPTFEPASGGADGSLLLSDDEIRRDENRGLEQYHAFITAKFAQYKSEGVGAADLIQFAGSVGIVSCPGGPIVPTVIGRNDSSEAAPTDLLPDAFGPGADQATLLQLFADKGISAAELVALIGVHTVSVAGAQEELPPGTPQDSTPATWDVRYYSETYDPPRGVGSFESDINLSEPNTTSGTVFQSFVGNRERWIAAFVPAMSRLSLLGISLTKSDGFVDCTGALPSTRPERRRRAVTAAAWS